MHLKRISGLSVSSTYQQVYCDFVSSPWQAEANNEDLLELDSKVAPNGRQT